MKSKMLSTCSAVIFFGLIGSHTSIAGQDLAIIIGNQDYADKDIPQVSYAGNDILNFQHYLNNIVGIADENIISVNNATVGDLTKLFGNNDSYKSEIWQRADPTGQGNLILYYSGHGYPSDGGGMILPTDTASTNPALFDLDIQDILAKMTNIGFKKILVVMESCFSGSSDGGSLTKYASPVYSSPINVETTSSNVTLITASQSNQIASWDTETQQGLFSKHYLNAAYGAGDSDNDGKVSLQEIENYLAYHMTSEARRTYGREQVSYIAGNKNLVIGVQSNLSPVAAVYYEDEEDDHEIDPEDLVDEDMDPEGDIWETAISIVWAKHGLEFIDNYMSHFDIDERFARLPRYWEELDDYYLDKFGRIYREEIEEIEANVDSGHIQQWEEVDSKNLINTPNRKLGHIYKLQFKNGKQRLVRKYKKRPPPKKPHFKP